MALSGLDIYKLLPKTNCRKCNFTTCLAFAMQLAKKAVSIDKCPYLSEEAKAVLEASAQPAIRLINIGTGENCIQIGNETVMFRHEEKFRYPCAIGFIIKDSLADDEIISRIKIINGYKFERVGQKIEVNLIAIEQTSTPERFAETVKLLDKNSTLNIVLASNDTIALKKALNIVGNKKPLIYGATKNNLRELAQFAKEWNAPLVVSGKSLDELSELSSQISNCGAPDLLLEPQGNSLAEKIWELTQIRRLAIKKRERSLGYPSLVRLDNTDPFEEAQEAAGYIAKYAAVVLLSNFDSFEALSLLTLRQNIYTDPQKPLQVEPKLYAIGAVNSESPVLITTNFSLSYFTVLGEVEASRIPSYIASIDTEGMSVLTAWAAEKFTPQKITNSLKKYKIKESVSHNNLIIPGYVSVMSGELKELSGFDVIVGPKEASGIPVFLKNIYK